MGNPRRRPKLLSAKLLAIREFLTLNQADMATKLQFEIMSHSCQEHQLNSARISNFEKEKREPNLFVMIAYARLGHIHLESVVDDEVSIDQFRTRLGKENPPQQLSRSTVSKSNRA